MPRGTIKKRLEITTSFNRKSSSESHESQKETNVYFGV